MAASKEAQVSITTNKIAPIDRITPLIRCDIDRIAVRGNLYICKCGDNGSLFVGMKKLKYLIREI